ncbi:hypothetical protein [Alteromonas sp. D210916BOD_24]|uniref:hypothetical protein n=1 Tax=Alteromonas sp. D210916BOD_24 TaxID=3157618 RepID=UPI00399D1A76
MFLVRSIIICLLFTLEAHGQHSTPTKVNTVNKTKSIVLGVIEFPPLVIKDKDANRCYGDGVESASRLLAHMGYRVLVECLPPARLFQLVGSGEVDATINVRGTSSLDNKVHFVDIPFDFLSLVMITNKEKANEKSVAAIRGYDYLGLRHALLEDGYTFFDMATSSEAIHLFEIGRTSALVTYEGPYNYYIQQFGATVPQTVVTRRRDIPTFLAISNHSKYHQQLVTDLKVLTKTIHEKTLKEHVKYSQKTLN